MINCCKRLTAAEDESPAGAALANIFSIIWDEICYFKFELVALAMKNLHYTFLALLFCGTKYVLENSSLSVLGISNFFGIWSSS